LAHSKSVQAQVTNERIRPLFEHHSLACAFAEAWLPHSIVCPKHGFCTHVLCSHHLQLVYLLKFWGKLLYYKERLTSGTEPSPSVALIAKQLKDGREFG
jgi:hypothetical protein